MREISTGGLLGGRLIYRQFQSGHRSGFEPVLLAAAVPAKTGQAILEAGTGAGAALLCLAARVPGVQGAGVEIDPALAALAHENFAANGFAQLAARNADITAHDFGVERFDHAMANPPWFEAAATPSPDGTRALARQATPDLLNAWVMSLTSALRPGGSLTLILPAAAYPQAVFALQAAGQGGLTLFPLWPRACAAAKLILISARKGRKTPARLSAGLVLHDDDGITPAAQAILRDGASLDLS